MVGVFALIVLVSKTTQLLLRFPHHPSRLKMYPCVSFVLSCFFRPRVVLSWGMYCSQETLWKLKLAFPVLMHMFLDPQLFDLKEIKSSKDFLCSVGLFSRKLDRNLVEPASEANIPESYLNFQDPLVRLPDEVAFARRS